MIPQTITESSVPRLAINLVSVYERPDRFQVLYDLLSERDETVNISHRRMPTWAEHVQFVESGPYRAWYLICYGDCCGACYLTRNDEIGVQIFKKYQGWGIGPAAVMALMEKHGPRRYLANINPHNERSASMFCRLGFNLVQHTYALQSRP